MSERKTGKDSYGGDMDKGDAEDWPAAPPVPGGGPSEPLTEREREHLDFRLQMKAERRAVDAGMIDLPEWRDWLFCAASNLESGQPAAQATIAVRLRWLADHLVRLSLRSSDLAAYEAAEQFRQRANRAKAAAAPVPSGRAEALALRKRLTLWAADFDERRIPGEGVTLSPAEARTVQILLEDARAALSPAGPQWARPDGTFDKAAWQAAGSPVFPDGISPAGPEGGARTGVALIAAERERQGWAEGWTAAHDDQHDQGEMAVAAAIYAWPDRPQSITNGWPWEWSWWKPTPENRLRELVKAGALIAAEIDRLLRAAPSTGEGDSR